MVSRNDKTKITGVSVFGNSGCGKKSDNLSCCSGNFGRRNVLCQNRVYIGCGDIQKARGYGFCYRQCKHGSTSKCYVKRWNRTEKTLGDKIRCKSPIHCRNEEIAFDQVNFRCAGDSRNVCCDKSERNWGGLWHRRGINSVCHTFR